MEPSTAILRIGIIYFYFKLGLKELSAEEKWVFSSILKIVKNLKISAKLSGTQKLKTFQARARVEGPE